MGFNDKINLTASTRQSLMGLKLTQVLMERTQGRLDTGKSVNSALDNAPDYFKSEALYKHAAQLNEAKSGIDTGISTIKATLDSLESVRSLVEQMRGLAKSVRSGAISDWTSLETDARELVSQMDQLIADSNVDGVNLISGTTLALGLSTDLTIELSEDTDYVLTGVDMASTAIGSLTAADGGLSNISFEVSNLQTTISKFDQAIEDLESVESRFATNHVLLTTRLNFTENLSREITGAADKITLADLNEEAANMLALQTRQQLGIQALSMASQSQQALLNLFR
ncbi:MAG: flagellin [Alphaproteobacteria bacterium]